MEKTALSFYVDDTNPYVVPPKAFKQFLDFVDGEGIRGESSVILGYDWEGQGCLGHPSGDPMEAYIDQVQRAFACGIEAHCELYTHHGLFDFESHCMPEDAIHEGLWLYEPAVTVDEYEAYFAHILDEADRLGFHYTGITWPGCGCEACTRRYQELHDAGVTDPNPNFWQALLNLVQAWRFRGNTVPCFFGGELEEAEPHLRASEGLYGVYTLPPNVGDRFGIWENDLQYVNADYYITEDGRSGRIVDLVRSRAPYCLFYAHWQGLNPANGVGWKAFTQVIRRIHKHLRGQVLWMRPSEYTDSLQVL